MNLSTYKKEEKSPFLKQDDQFEFDRNSEMQFCIEDDDLDMNNASLCKGMRTRWHGLKIVFLVKGGSVIYVMITKHKTESTTFMKKQLAVLHTALVSIATKNFISVLRTNSCYDIMADSSVYRQLPSLSFLCNTMPQNPFSFLNLFLPLRLHPLTRNLIDGIITKHRNALSSGKLKQSSIHSEQANADSDPEEDAYYFGLMFLDETVVTIFKNNQNIRVTPADINVILNFMKTN